MLGCPKTRCGSSSGPGDRAVQIPTMHRNINMTALPTNVLRSSLTLKSNLHITLLIYFAPFFIQLPYIHRRLQLTIKVAVSLEDALPLSFCILLYRESRSHRIRSIYHSIPSFPTPLKLSKNNQTTGSFSSHIKDPG